MQTCDKFVKPWGCAFFATICTMLLGLPAFADPVQIDPDDYACSFNIKFSGYSCASTLENFPVLVRLSKDLNGFDYSKCAANGADLRFSDAATGEMLPSEIDTWNTVGTSLVWVKVKSLNRLTAVKACYGYKGEGQPPEVSAADVWDSNYVGVWHLGESTTPLNESTGVSTPFATAAGTPGYAQAGAIGGAVNFTAGNLRAAHDPDLDGFYGCTFEMWMKKLEHQAENGNLYILNKRTSSNSNLSYFLYDKYYTTDPAHGLIMNLSTNGTGAISWADKSRYPELNVWSHDVWVRKPGETVDHYLDGVISQTSTWAQGMGTEPVFAGSADLVLGASQDNGGRFRGLIDELRISRVVRSADWIKASHDCVADERFAVYEAGDDDNDWTKYSHKFTVAFPDYVGDELENFPVLVRISESTIEGFDYDDCLRPNGDDLRFVGADGTLLASEVDTWNVNGTSLVWVKVPSLSAATRFTAYYGRATIGPSSKPYEVWDDDYKAVWHMNGNIVTIPDSTSGGGDLQYWRTGGFNSSKVNVEFAEGIAGNAVEFGVYSDKVGCLATRASSSMLTNEAACTVELWMYQDHHDPADATGRYLMKEVLSTGNNGIYTIYEYKADKDSNLQYQGEIVGYVLGAEKKQCWISSFTPVVTPERAQWHYQVIRYDSSDGKYANILDTVSVKSGTYNVGTFYCDPSSVDTLYVGASQSSDTSWPGKVDEIRISKVARSDAWLKATYDTIKNAGFASYGDAVRNVTGFLTIIR